MDTPLLLALLVPLLGAATWTDVRERRIPNLLCLAGMLAGLAAWALVAGLDGFTSAAAGLGIAFAVTLPFWLLGWMGAGDVKLCAAVGACTGSALVWQVLAAIGIAGFFLAVLALAQKKLLARAWERFAATISLSVAARRAVYVEPGAAEREVRLPYAVAIAAGTLTAVLVAA